MKMIKYKLFSFIAFIFCVNIVIGQTSNWSTIMSPRGNFQFSFPNNIYTTIDTLNTIFYVKDVDTILSIQVHYINNVTVSTTDSVWTMLLAQNNNDTLRAMGGFMLVLANGQLTSIQDLNSVGNNPKGIEISMTCPGENAANNVIFSRLYLQNGRFHAFSVGSVENDVDRLNIYKTIFFNSINFSLP